MSTVIKVGGNELDDPSFVATFAQTVANINPRPTIVHGGGKELTTLLSQMGIESKFIEGLRVTDEASLSAAEMIFRGKTNLRLVRALVNEGLPALGLSGVDAELVRVEKLHHASGDLGFVGIPVRVNTAVLSALLNNGLVPVISPICLGVDGQNYNVNADHIAAAIAATLPADLLIFLTNVQGVLIQGERAATLTAAEVEGYIADGSIYGGMIPKVRSALTAISQGVKRVMITNLTGLHAVAHGATDGTTITA